MTAAGAAADADLSRLRSLAGLDVAGTIPVPFWPRGVGAIAVGVIPKTGLAERIEALALDDGAVLARARIFIARMARLHLCGNGDCDPGRTMPAPGYVLVADQPPGTAPAPALREMLAVARIEHPAARIYVLGPDHGPGTLPEILPSGAERLEGSLSPWALCEGATAVYARDAEAGLIAILAGHRPRLFGTPLWAGWGLSLDEDAPPRRRRLTRAQLVGALMIDLALWYDPVRDRLCSAQEALDQAEAALRPWREDRAGHVAIGMARWKRRHLRQFFGSRRPLAFAATPERAAAALAAGRQALLWGAADAGPVAAPLRVEDGYLRSRGLGAALVPPLSLVIDDLGLACDPSRESRLERLIAAPPPPGAEERARHLVERIRREGLTKYGPAGGAGLPPLPEGRRILVAGQVEDDAGLLLAAGTIRSNADLLARVRAEHPDAVILWRAHPDVAAGYRAGAFDAGALASADLTGVPVETALAVADEVWTISSTIGFEALLRGLPVTCLGAPFYAGWGLTRDLGPPVARRRARPTLAALAHAALIAYPRYLDPVTGLPCPAETVVERLARGEVPAPPAGLRLLSRLQRWTRPLARLRRRPQARQ